MTSVFVALGSCLPLGSTGPAALVRRALAALDAGAFSLVRTSSLWRSRAWPPESGGSAYINAVCELRTTLARPQEALLQLIALEARFGRDRGGGRANAPRTLDLDLLDWGGAVVFSPPELVVPHPLATRRDFVLAPLLEIAPDWHDPATGRAGTLLLSALRAAMPPGAASQRLDAAGERAFDAEVLAGQG